MSFKLPWNLALVIRHPNHIFSASIILSYCSSLSHKRQDFREKIIEHKICVLNFLTTFVPNISPSKNKPNSTKYFHKCAQMLTWRYPWQILIKVEFSLRIFEKFSNLVRIRQVGVQLLRADRLTYMTKLIVAFAVRKATTKWRKY